jgi:hypothetical protein
MRNRLRPLTPDRKARRGKGSYAESCCGAITQHGLRAVQASGPGTTRPFVAAHQSGSNRRVSGLPHAGWHAVSRASLTVSQPPGQSGNAGVSLTPSDIEGSTNRDRVGVCFETEISRCALDSRMAQRHSYRLQIAGPFQDVGVVLNARYCCLI